MEKRKRKVIKKDMIIVAIGSNLSSGTFGLPESNCFECLKILKKVCLKHLGDIGWYKSQQHHLHTIVDQI